MSIGISPPPPRAMWWGEPWIALRAVDDDQDRLSAVYANSPEFRWLIEERRREQSIPWDEAKKQLDAEKVKSRPTAPTAKNLIFLIDIIRFEGIYVDAPTTRYHFVVRRLTHCPERIPMPASASHRRSVSRRARLPLRSIERLESRALLSASALMADPIAQPLAHFAYSSGLSGSSQTPDMIRHAYGFDRVAGDGSGQTIAIVDAYGDSKIASDLDTFDKTFGTSTYWGGQTPPADFTRSSSAFFSKLDQNGGHSYPSNNGSWDLETALDVEWAHAIAPGANIVLVEAKSASTSDLLAAVDTASKQTGVVAVSMSWGSSEFSGETALDSHFTKPGVTYVAASGDTGGQVIWPSASPNVLSVGGTTLTTNWPSGETNKNGPFDYGYEIGWQDSGGGASVYEAEPSGQAQSGLVTQSGTNRVTPDVAYNADPVSGVAVYSSISYNFRSGWSEVGGTSAGAPQWAALAAVADGLRKAGGLSALGDLQADAYYLASPNGAGAYASDFHDVTASYAPNGSPEQTPGYDVVTGIGSPQANNLIAALSGLSEAAAATMTTASVASSAVAAPGVAVQASAVIAAPSGFSATVSSIESSDEPSHLSSDSGLAVVAPAMAANPAATDAVFAAFAYPDDDGRLG